MPSRKSKNNKVGRPRTRARSTVRQPRAYNSKLREYLVVWAIEIGAEDAERACREALDIMQDKHSTATVFHVTLEGDRRVTKVLNTMRTIDLNKLKWVVKRRKA